MSPSHSNITDTGSKKGELVKNVSDPHIFCRKKEATVNSLEVTRTSGPCSGQLASHDADHAAAP